MDRRRLLQIAAAAVAFLPNIWSSVFDPIRAAAAARSMSRVRPSDPEWPAEASWKRLSQKIGGRLVKVQSPLSACVEAPSGPSCAQIFKEQKNPYYLGDEVGLMQTLGWIYGWTSRPSAFAVAVQTTDDIVAAVNFARANNLRLVVKGGGHSYQGTSNAADSLLIWTRRMNTITLHDAFVGSGCGKQQPPQEAVTVEAGCHLGTGLPGYDQGQTLRPGWWMPYRWRSRLDPERRFPDLLESLWDGCSESLFNPHWGNEISLRPENILVISMVFQGLSRQQAEMNWRPFFE